MTEEKFVEENIGLIGNVINKSESIRKDQDLLKKLKQDLMDSLAEFGFDRLENDDFKMSVIGESLSTTIDIRKLEQTEPALYARLLNDYLKTMIRRSYLKVMVKEG